jgi:chemotaxis signal transduction protein
MTTATAPQLYFRLSSEIFGLPLSDVREVALPGSLSRVPLAAAAVLGVMNLRGRIVLVVDLGLLLGLAAAGRGGVAERIVVLDEGRRDLGLLVSEVVEISNLAAPVGDPTEEGSAPVEPLAGGALVARVGALLKGPLSKEEIIV